MRCKVAFTYVYDDDGGLFEQKGEVIDLLETIPAHGSQAGFDVRRAYSEAVALPPGLRRALPQRSVGARSTAVNFESKRSRQGL